ncbi:ribulose-phosphate 3-epimerase [Streptococcus chenjunshii]|uniref:Ribulose-phosphate 3-epimerase n=1 Tax=Streptococcus chenjunshii TaxID=2173853 RepID=A0A372KL04_9STRE|nr:ribulose-phosphate 3-epimerase [Streptococcus chenjunshii]AXQ79209.1 ribulose-phosphate 3-epimerase [Streptococcus chenjunshii]RFU50781.1 ribulose-phosphate 3-epimerase [Streptococcus chenjunshii]RFU52962.1 ribulose-phosphate 3-epimerase [Streptococcus chenjunshii]
MTQLLCPSMMCADFACLEDEVERLDQAGFDIFHMDFMDGSFVPNFGMGLQDFELVRKTTAKPVDVHLMIQNPGRYVDKFAALGADIIYIHPEADQQVTRTLARIKEKGKKAGVAINPGTSAESIKPFLSLVDYVLIMTVNPGFAGQNYLDFVEDKILDFVNLKPHFDYEIMVDGAISPEHIKRLSRLGVKGFILGTSSVFGKDRTYQEIEKELRG